jgi:hypothetical protein
VALELGTMAEELPPDSDRSQRRLRGRTLRASSLGRAVSSAMAEELVRGFLAVWLVGVLIALVFLKPPGGLTSAPVASAKTLAIAVIAFYFGLHKGTPQKDHAAKTAPTDTGRSEPGDSAGAWTGE